MLDKSLGKFLLFNQESNRTFRLFLEYLNQLKCLNAIVKAHGGNLRLSQSIPSKKTAYGFSAREGFLLKRARIKGLVAMFFAEK